MADPDNSALEDAKKRARRRLVGAVVLALAAAVVLPMFLESDPRPLGPDVQIQIPAIDDAKFQNRLTPAAAPKAAVADKGVQLPPEPPKGPAADAGTAAPPVAVAADSAAPKAEPPAPAPAVAPTPGETKTEAPPAAVAVAPSPAPPARKPVAKASPAASASPAPAPARKVVAPPPLPAPAPAPAAALPAFSLTATVPPLGATPAPSAVPPPVVRGQFVVQLGAYVDMAVAGELAHKAGEQGYSAFLEPVTTKSGQVQRVRVGPFATRDEADAAAAKLKGAGFTAVTRPR